MDEKQRYTFDIFVAFLTPVDTLTNSALASSDGYTHQQVEHLQIMKKTRCKYAPTRYGTQGSPNFDMSSKVPSIGAGLQTLSRGIFPLAD